MDQSDPRDAALASDAPVALPLRGGEPTGRSGGLIGRVIANRFVIEALVGEGAMGAVYRAKHLALDTTVAVKVLHRPYVRDPAFAARFLNEAQAASRIDHPNSMRVIDFGEERDGLLFIAMEYLDGRTLDSVLAETGPMPVERIVDVASQILAALAVAHEMGVVHRDLKPENIVLLDGTDDEGNRHDIVKVCDFGVAKLMERRDNAHVTSDGVIIGTPAYMSPEQARGYELDGRSDLYAMGVLLFQLMTGNVPFDGPTPMGTALMHVTDEPTRPCVLNPRVDDRLEAICMKAMRKRKEERYQSARELRADLRTLLSVETRPRKIAPLLEQVSPPVSSRRSRSLVFGVTLAATAAVGALTLFAPRSSSVVPPPPSIAQTNAPAPPSALAPAAVAPPAPPPEPAVRASPIVVHEDPVKEPPRAAARAKSKPGRRPVTTTKARTNRPDAPATVDKASDTKLSPDPVDTLPLPVFKDTPSDAGHATEEAKDSVRSAQPKESPSIKPPSETGAAPPALPVLPAE